MHTAAEQPTRSDAAIAMHTAAEQPTRSDAAIAMYTAAERPNCPCAWRMDN